MGVMAPYDVRRVRYVTAKSEWTLGLDLGALVDPSALAVVEHRTNGTGEWELDAAKVSHEIARDDLYLRYIERIPLKSSYLDVVDYVGVLLAKPPIDGKGTLVIDRTGVGQPVVDIFRAKGETPITVCFTGGDQTHQDGYDFRVPKTTLINNLIAKIDCGELTAAEGLPDRAAFEDELLSFRRKTGATGHVSYGGESGHHDDLVCAVALAVWLASRPRMQRRILRFSIY